MTARPRVGLVGGSGVYDLAAMENLREERLETPFGSPSDAFFTGTLGAVPVAFLSRHGRGHPHATAHDLTRGRQRVGQ